MWARLRNASYAVGLTSMPPRVADDRCAMTIGFMFTFPLLKVVNAQPARMRCMSHTYLTASYRCFYLCAPGSSKEQVHTESQTSAHDARPQQSAAAATRSSSPRAPHTVGAQAGLKGRNRGANSSKLQIVGYGMQVRTGRQGCTGEMQRCSIHLVCQALPVFSKEAM